MIILIKMAFGALIVLLISILSTTKYYFIAGLVPLFPTFALIAHIIVGQKGGYELKQTVLFGMLSIIPYFFYLLSVYLLVDRVKLGYNFVISISVWLIFAIIIYLFWKKLMG